MIKRLKFGIKWTTQDGSANRRLLEMKDIQVQFGGLLGQILSSGKMEYLHLVVMISRFSSGARLKFSDKEWLKLSTGTRRPIFI